MNTHTHLSAVARLVLAAVFATVSASCGGELLRTGRSPVYLVITGIIATTGASSAFLQSDVQSAGGAVFNDNVTVNVLVERKNSTIGATPVNSVTLTRYRVNFRRTDGRNTPGTDVPYGFDGVLSTTISAGGSGGVSFAIVRHQMKLEPPLKNIAGFNDAGGRSISGLGFLATIAEITIWGRDQNGNEVTATGSIEVHFGDFADA